MRKILPFRAAFANEKIDERQFRGKLQAQTGLLIFVPVEGPVTPPSSRRFSW